MNHFIQKAAALALSLLLLACCVFPAGATSIDVTNFEIKTVSDTEIQVVWAASTDEVLKSLAADGRTAQMTIDCGFAQAYVWYGEGSQVVSSTLDTGNKKLTFALPGAGTYTVSSGESPYRTVTFNTNGGSAVDPKWVKAGDLVTKPTDPTREGYTLTGWYKDAELKTAWNFSTDTVTSDLTLYAGWTQKSTEDSAPSTPTTTPTEGTTSGITKVEISPQKVTLKPGGTQQFTATVSGSGTFSKEVTWSLSGNQYTATTISSTGKLTIASGEPNGTLTVTVTSREDPTKTASATVKVRRSVLSNPTTGDYIRLAVITLLLSGGALALLLLLHRRGRDR